MSILGTSIYPHIQRKLLSGNTVNPHFVVTHPLDPVPQLFTLENSLNSIFVHLVRSHLLSVP